MLPLILMVVLLLHFISLSIAKRNDDFPLPISPSTTINFPFGIVVLIPRITDEY